MSKSQEPQARLATGSRLPTGASERLQTGASERLATGSSSTTSSSRPLTNATPAPLVPTLPPIVEHYYGFANSYVDDMKHTGVRKTQSDINKRLGYFTTPGEPRLIGSFGYTSPSYTDLKPAAPAARVATKPHGPTTAGVTLRPIKGGSAGATRSMLSERDIEFLRERDADNQQVFEVWSQRKQLELQLEKEEAERRRADADARFEAREQAIQEVNSSAMKQWTQKKVKQQRADAEDSYLRQIKLRALAAYQARINNAYEAKSKKREQGFEVRTDVGVLPPSFEGFTHKPQRGLAGERSNKSLSSRSPGKEKSTASYRSGGEAEEEASIMALMGGRHPIPNHSSRRAVSETHPPGHGLAALGGGAGSNSGMAAEPSFASVARAGGGGSRSGSPKTLPPLAGHPFGAQSGQHADVAPVAEDSSEGAQAAGRSVSRSSSTVPVAVVPPALESAYAPKPGERESGSADGGGYSESTGEAGDEDDRSAARATRGVPPGGDAGSDAGPVLHAGAGLMAAYGGAPRAQHNTLTLEAEPSQASSAPAPASGAASRQESLVSAPAAASRQESLASAPGAASRQESLASAAPAGPAPPSRAASMAASSAAPGAASRQESLASVSAPAAASRQESLASVSAPVPASRQESLASASALAGASRQESLASASAPVAASRQESLTQASGSASRQESLAQASGAASRQESLKAGGLEQAQEPEPAQQSDEAVGPGGPAPPSRSASQAASRADPASRQASMSATSGPGAPSRQESVAASAAGPGPASRQASMSASAGAGPGAPSRQESSAAGASDAAAVPAEARAAEAPSAPEQPSPSSTAHGGEISLAPSAINSMAAPPPNLAAQLAAAEDLEEEEAFAEAPEAPASDAGIAGADAEAEDAGAEVEAGAGYGGAEPEDDDDLGSEPPLPRWDDDDDADEVLAAVAAAQGQGLEVH